MDKLKKLQFRVRLFGAIVGIVLLKFSDYHNNDYLIYGIILIYMLFAFYVRFGKFSDDEELFINRAVLYMDVGVLTVAVAVRGGLRSDFYLGYYLIMGYVMHVRDKYLIYKLSLLITVAYSLVAFSFGDPEAFSYGRLLIRLTLMIGTSIVFQIYVRELMHSENQKEDALHMAFNDALTKVYNRRMLEFIERDFNHKEDITHAVLIDIDDFKGINDSYGHDIGDQVLVELSRILDNECHFKNTCIRYGGEEFLILIEHKDFQEVVDEVDRLRHMFATTIFKWQESSEYITFTAGIAPRTNGETLNQLIRKADTAMYKGKYSGKNQVVFYENI